MVMSDDLDQFRFLDGAMTVMKIKFIRRPGINELDRSIQLPIVIPTNHNHFAKRADLLEKLARLKARRAIVHKIAQNDESLGLIIGQ